MKKFEITDVVEFLDDDKLYFVTAVIPVGERLFVTPDRGKEIEVDANKVINRWSHKAI